MAIHNISREIVYVKLYSKSLKMESANTVKFLYAINESIVKVKSPSGVRMHIESYACMDGISDGPHYLRLRRASHSNYDHQVTLKLTAPDCSELAVRRTLVFNRGTTLLNLKIEKEDILFLMGPARRKKLLGELTVQHLEESARTYTPRNNGPIELCKPDEYTSLKSYETSMDLRMDIDDWQGDVEVVVDSVLLNM